MSALRDPRLEKFAQALASNIAAGMKRGAAADLAAETAGYKGTSRAANARKRSQRADVKARVAELGGPVSQKVAERVEATREYLTDKLLKIMAPDLGDDAIKVADQLTAGKLMAQIHGWLAPEKHSLTDPTGEHDRLDQLLREIDGKTRGLPSEAHNDAVTASTVTAGSLTASGAA